MKTKQQQRAELLALAKKFLNLGELLSETARKLDLRTQDILNFLQDLEEET